MPYNSLASSYVSGIFAYNIRLIRKVQTKFFTIYHQNTVWTVIANSDLIFILTFLFIRTRILEYYDSDNINRHAIVLYNM